MKLPTDAQVRVLLRPEAYQKVLRAKASSVKTATDLEALDDWYRYNLSSSTRERGFMTKDELVKLMTWKLARGKYRPTLASLIASNSEEQVRFITQKAVDCQAAKSQVKETMGSGPGKLKEVQTQFNLAVDELMRLKGVGPATASAIISLLDPDDEPFFSDELAEWISSTTSGKDSGPQTKLKNIPYTLKFYNDSLRPGVNHLREELSRSGLSLTADQVERVAWTWWNGEKYGVDLFEEGEEDPSGLAKSEERGFEEQRKEEQNGIRGKRKAGDGAKSSNNAASGATSEAPLRTSKRIKASKQK